MDQRRRFHDLVGAGRVPDCSVRCRLVVDEVNRRHTALADPSHPSADEDELWWLASSKGREAAIAAGGPLIVLTP